MSCSHRWWTEKQHGEHLQDRIQSSLTLFQRSLESMSASSQRIHGLGSRQWLTRRSETCRGLLQKFPLGCSPADGLRDDCTLPASSHQPATTSFWNRTFRPDQQQRQSGALGSRPPKYFVQSEHLRAKRLRSLHFFLSPKDRMNAFLS